MKFAIFLVALLATFSASYGCRCLPLREPQECQTEYLMLVKITGALIDNDNHQRSYTFTLIRDISYPAPFSTTFTHIYTGWDSGSCRLDLEVGSYYLLGGQTDQTNNVLWATTCNTYWKKWSSNESCIERGLTKIQKKCIEYHASNSTTKI